MALRDHLAEIQQDLKAGRFPNEAAVSQGIVLRVLQQLGWPIYATEKVSPEYSVEGRRVDYALCHPPRRPAVFVEVKKVGETEGADRQLFEYAFHQGVPMAVLTDGQVWHFYLPAEQGEYQQRRVYKLDLLERELDESTFRLGRYLSYDGVCSGECLRAARQDYQDVAKNREIERTLPIAWQDLVNEQDDLLAELVADRVESLCGYKPQAHVVTDFLAQQLRLVIEPVPTPRPVPPPPQPVPVQGVSKPPPRRPAVTGGIMKAHGAVEFVRISGSEQATAKKVKDMLDIARILHYHSIRSHEFAGCAGVGKCGQKGHGDAARRVVLHHLEELDRDGWRVRFADGRTESVTILQRWVHKTGG